MNLAQMAPKQIGQVCGFHSPDQSHYLFFFFFLYGSITLNPLASQLGCSSPAGISGKVHNMLCEQGICFKAHTHTCKFALEGQKLRVTSPPRCWQPNPNVHPPVPTARLLRSAELRLEWESGRFCMRKRHFLG